MKETEIKKLLYQQSEAFQEGYKVGKQETLEEVYEWLKNNLTPLIDNTQRIAWSYWVIKELRKHMEK